ncbi:MAG: Hsp33 family molecular chaperone HslO [Lachnospiraceae bacterium]|nr:Hsp33 family molecular chaperone HslO [Lachnospiraceae bacterium]
MSDYMIRGTAAGGMIRFFAAYTKDMVETARDIHHTTPVATAALGRLLTGGSMMGAMLKNEDDLLTLQIQCNGPIGGLTVTADSHGRTKGYVVNPEVELTVKDKGKLDVGASIGLGVLSVIKDIGLKDPYIGQTELVTGEIAEDLTNYFAVSEQVPTAVALGVLVDTDCSVKTAGGFIIQMLPDSGKADEYERLVTVLEERLKGFEAVTTQLEKGVTIEEMMEKLFDGYDVSILDKNDISYFCGCSKERVTNAIAGISKADLLEMIEDEKPIEVDCHFCGKHYVFTTEELKVLVNG